MTLRYFRSHIVAGAIASVALVAPQRALSGQYVTATITGHVKDRNGAAAVGISVEVRANSSRRNARETVTGADGGYAVEMSPDTATAFDVRLSGPGWIPTGSTCHRALNATRVVCDAVIRPTTPLFTAAPNEPQPIVVDRARLGASDALEIVVPRGRIFVAGSWDDSVHVSYQLRRDISGPRRDSMLVLPSYDGKLGVTFGANGMQLQVAPADLPPSDGVDVRITVPRKLKVIKLTMTQSGEIGVEDFDGELVIKSEGGAVHLANLNGPTLVEARTGDITATVQSTIARQPVSLLTRSGNIHLMLGPGWGAAFDIETRNGTIMSRPALDGSIAIPATPSGVVGIGPHHASGRFGLDGPLFRIVTLYGNVSVQQWSGPGEMPRWIGKP